MMTTTTVKFPGYKIYSDGRIYTENRKKFLEQSLDRRGYPRVNIQCEDGKRRSVRIHRIMALAFLPNPENKPQVNHKNGIKTDNYIDNLEWSTRSENIKHSFDYGIRKVSDKVRLAISQIGKMQKGSLHPKSKKIINIETGEVFDTVEKAAESASIKRPTLSSMLTGKRKNKTSLRYYQHT